MSKNNHRGAAAQGPYVAVGGDFTGSSVEDAALAVALAVTLHADAARRLAVADAPVHRVASDLLVNWSTPCHSPPSEEARAARRRRDEASQRRYDLRDDVLKGVTECERVCRCGDPRADVVTVERVLSPDGDAYQRVEGLYACASYHLCPVCKCRIAAHDAREWGEAFERHLQGGGGLVMGLLSVPHDREDLGAVWDRLDAAGAYALTQSGGDPVKRVWDRYGIVGCRSGDDVTYGSLYGWNPHRHFVLVTKRPLSRADLYGVDEDGRVCSPDDPSPDSLQGWYLARLNRFAKRHGLPAFALGGNGLQPVTTAKAAAAYLSGSTGRKTGGATFATVEKATYETVGSAFKRGQDGMTPFELLAWCEEECERMGGDMAAFDLWREYEAGTMGRSGKQRRRRGSSSKGLRAYLGMDEEATEEEAAREVVHVASPVVREHVHVAAREWVEVVQARPGREYALRRAFRDGGEVALWSLLDAWRVSDGGARGAPRGSPFGVLVGEA